MKRVTLRHVFEHVGIHLLSLLSPKDKRTLQLASTFFRRYYREHETKLALSIGNGRRWSEIVEKFAQLQHLHVFPNTLPFVRSVQLHRLVTLNLSWCGLSHVNLKPLGLVNAFREMTNLRHLYLTNNTNLRSSGLSRLLSALKRAGAVLEGLYASKTGVRRIPHEYFESVLRRIKILNLSGNAIAKNTAIDILTKMPCLEKLFMDLQVNEVDKECVLDHSNIKVLSWWHAQTTADTCAFLSCDRITAISLSCDDALECKHIGHNLTRLSLSNIDMPDTSWKSFMKHLGQSSSLQEFVMCKVKRLSIRSMCAFVESHREPTALVSFGLSRLLLFTYEHLMTLCAALTQRHIKLQKWVLTSCPALYFQLPAQPFIDTLHATNPVSLDFNTRTPLSLRRNREALWMEQVLLSAQCSYLGLGGRSVVAELPTTVFHHLEQLCLESTEINWGFTDDMVHIKAVSLYNVESLYYRTEELVQQVLRLPRLSHLRLDYCRLDEDVVFPLAKHLTMLDLSWCTIGNRFRNRLLHALVTKKCPALSTLGIMSSSPSFVCLLVLAMRQGHRNCQIDARGHFWTVAQLKFLRISLRQLALGDVSQLHLNIHSEAQAEFDAMRSSFPLIVM